MIDILIMMDLFVGMIFLDVVMGVCFFGCCVFMVGFGVVVFGIVGVIVSMVLVQVVFVVIGVKDVMWVESVVDLVCFCVCDGEVVIVVGYWEFGDVGFFVYVGSEDGEFVVNGGMVIGGKYGICWILQYDGMVDFWVFGIMGLEKLVDDVFVVMVNDFCI